MPSDINSKIKEWGLPSWYLTVFNILVIGFFGLIALGGSVRIMKAGLACPDWPLCFGDFIPDYHPQVYFEFIHRVIAGIGSLASLFMAIVMWRSRAPRILKFLMGAVLVMLIVQIVLGGLTVLKLLQSGIVAAHLMTGTACFLVLLWIYLSLKPEAKEKLGPKWLLRWSGFVFLAAYGQIFLGALVAAHFASLVCVDFPTCHGQWFPTFSGIIGLHVIHRLGAYILCVILLANWLTVRKVSSSPAFRKLAGVIMLMMVGQIALGISNVLLHTPPLIAVAHLAMGVGILSVALRQLHMARA